MRSDQRRGRTVESSAGWPTGARLWLLAAPVALLVGGTAAYADPGKGEHVGSRDTVTVIVPADRSTAVTVSVMPGRVPAVVPATTPAGRDRVLTPAAADGVPGPEATPRSTATVTDPPAGPPTTRPVPAPVPVPSDAPPAEPTQPAGDADTAEAAPRPATAGAAPQPQDRPMFFVDCTAGDDGAAGSQAAPWRTPASLSGRTLPKDAVVFLKKGCTWDGAVTIKDEGVVIATYGQGEPPTITATDAPREQGAVTIASPGGMITGVRVADTAGPGITLAGERSVAHDVEVERTAFGIRFTGASSVANEVAVRDLHLYTSTPTSENGNDDAGAVGFNVESDNVTVQNSSCDGCRAPSDDYGYDGGFVEVWRKGSGLRVLNNRAVNVDGLLEVGGLPGDPPVTGILIRGNRMTQVHGRAFYINDVGDYAIDASGIQVRDNQIQVIGGVAATGLVSAFDIDGSNRIGESVTAPSAGTGPTTG